MVNDLQGSALAKKRLAMFLKTIGGACAVGEACQTLGVTEAAFFRMRQRWLQESVEGLEPRKPGPAPRERTVAPAEVEALREELSCKERALLAAAVREELALTMPFLVDEKKGSRPEARRRRTWSGWPPS